MWRLKIISLRLVSININNNVTLNSLQGLSEVK